MNRWIDHLQELATGGEDTVVITVVETRGSAPRDVGAKMVVTNHDCFGTIGGGELERVAMEDAWTLLASPPPRTGFVKKFALGPSLGQCCGGVSSLVFEPIETGASDWIDTLSTYRKKRIPAALLTQLKSGVKRVVTEAMLNEKTELTRDLKQMVRDALKEDRTIYRPDGESETVLVEALNPSDFNIVLFGAGHVGKAMVDVLSPLPCEIIWVDSREKEYPLSVADNVHITYHQSPEYFVDEAQPGSYYLIMTHSHPLDQEICERILKRNDFAYCGLIGSVTKRRKFEKRLKLRGVAAGALEKLVCPIGISGISGKRPQEIAVAVAAEILQIREVVATTSRERTRHQLN